MEIIRQPKFDFFIDGRKLFTYKADFKVKYANGEIEVVDVKGMRTPVYRLKKKLIEAAHHVRIIEV